MSSGRYGPAALPLAHLPRNRLHAVLDRVPPGGTGVVMGLAGTGKTTAVREWIDTIPDEVCWVHLEGADPDPLHFWSLVIESVRQVLPGAGQEVLDDVLAVEAARLGSIADAIDRLDALGQPVVVVLDDMHHGADVPPQQANSWVLSILPSNLRVIATTRDRLRWPIPRLVAMGRLAVVDADDLRLTVDEAQAIVDDLAGVAVDRHVVADLVDRTEGWPACVQLAGRELARHLDDPARFVRTLSGASPALAPFLESEVLAAADPEVVDLLVVCVPLDVLSPAVCDVVADREGSAEVLQAAADVLLLTAVEQRDDAWRVPRLVRDLLARRLRDKGSGGGPLSAGPVHRRAADWYVAAGEPELAVPHLAAAGDPARSFDHLVRHGATVIGRGRPDLVGEWGRSIAPEWLDAEPQRHLEVAWAVGLAGNTIDANLHVSRALALGSTGPMISCLAWWAATGTGDPDLADKLVHEADTFDPDHLASRMRWLVQTQLDIARGDPEAATAGMRQGLGDPLGSPMVVEHMRRALLAEVAFVSGDLRAARDHGDAAVAAWRQAGVPVGRSMLPALRTLLGLAIEEGDLGTAGAYREQAEAAVAGSNPTTVPFATTTAAIAALLVAEGSAGEAIGMLEHLRHEWAAIPRVQPGPIVVAIVADAEARALLAAGERDRALTCLAEVAPLPAAPLLAARLALAAGDRAAAAEQLEWFTPISPRQQLEALLLGARAEPNDAAARQLAAQAIATGHTLGFRQTVLAERSLHGHYRAVYRTAPSAAVRSLVRVLDDEPAPTGSTSLLDPLTGRERVRPAAPPDPPHQPGDRRRAGDEPQHGQDPREGALPEARGRHPIRRGRPGPPARARALISRGPAAPAALRRH